MTRILLEVARGRWIQLCRLGCCVSFHRQLEGRVGVGSATTHVSIMDNESIILSPADIGTIYIVPPQTHETFNAFRPPLPAVPCPRAIREMHPRQ